MAIRKELRSIIARSQAISNERKELLDRLWLLENESQKLAGEFFQKAGRDEVELVLKLEGKETRITDVKVKAGSKK